MKQLSLLLVLSGEMEITKVDDKWAEGTFSFLAGSSQSNKTLTVASLEYPLRGRNDEYTYPTGFFISNQ